MKQIFKNKFIKSYIFNSYEESLTFRNNQPAKSLLELDNSFGDKCIYYVCFDSITEEKLFCISFFTDMNHDELIFFPWHESKLFVIDTGKEIYLVNNALKIVSSFDITSSLIGLHVTNDNKLLILEEASMRLVDFEGKVLMNNLFDLLEEFNIKDDILSIKTAEEQKSFKLK